MEPKRISTPLTDEVISSLRAGDSVLLTGEILTARDAAHKRLVEAIESGKELPLNIKGQVIYYVGPSPAKPNRVIGSAGPTTSYRMDPYAPLLYKLGLKATIGKGQRSDEVKDILRRFNAVYFLAVGGAGALLAQRIKRQEIILYEDLGPEAIRRLYVEDFPLLVANDAHGGDLFEEGAKNYSKV